MIRVHLKPEFSMQPRTFDNAADWIIDAESGNLTVTGSHRVLASFAPGAWVYVESIVDEPLDGAA